MARHGHAVCDRIHWVEIGRNWFEGSCPLCRTK